MEETLKVGDCLILLSGFKEDTYTAKMVICQPNLEIENILIPATSIAIYNIDELVKIKKAIAKLEKFVKSKNNFGEEKCS